MVLNGVAILNNERFLEKRKQQPAERAVEVCQWERRSFRSTPGI